MRKKKLKTCMDLLPTELQLQIISHLPATDLANLACMNYEWRRLILSICDSEDFWKNMCLASNSWRNRWKKMGFSIHHTRHSNTIHHRYGRSYEKFDWSWKDLYALWIACGDGCLYHYLLFKHAKEGLHNIKAAFRLLG